ncbi:hypothetical protein GCM10023189_36790 [Nibrella saemangeumensis]|uniref:Uncharacterized protein n=1 Tax=Nibrella saemangeumensis TaxID=1084526 RepID=A0ABP8N7R6_9BACT
MPSNIVTIKAHEDFDYSYMVFGTNTILTKQDRYKQVDGYKAVFQNESDKTMLEEYELYVKHKGKDSLRRFEEKFKADIQATVKDDHPYDRSIPLEIISVFYMSEDRYKTVDIDNLLKTVIDCFKGLIFEDDSQIQNVLGMKRAVQPGFPDAILIGIRKLDKKGTWFSNIHLISITEDGKTTWLV